MFHKSGDQSAYMSQALGQILDWQEWMHSNIAYARDNIEALKNVHEPEYWLIMGRRPRSARDVTTLLRLNRSIDCRIMSYDDLVSQARRFAANLRKFAG
jgi:hypothetical protein